MEYLEFLINLLQPVLEVRSSAVNHILIFLENLVGNSSRAANYELDTRDMRNNNKKEVNLQGRATQGNTDGSLIIG